MKKQEKPSSINKKGAVVGLVICFVGAIAMVGTYTFRQYQNGTQQEQELAKAKLQEEADKKQKSKELETQTTNADKIVLPDNTREERTKTPMPTVIVEEAPSAPAQTSGVNASVHFQDTDLLEWPVEGNIVLNYSMDKTVYFSTLDQYKYNPALIIAGQQDGAVVAAGRGIVKSIDVTAQTGNTITLDMGNGYQAIYGQLKEVPVQVGELVEPKQNIGYLSEPTKYYSVEGCNLYFQMLKDGVPVNPMNYMDA
ncbi:MAG: M23 family metallopeptidase [Lachnospiraceae bacterium]